MPETNSPAPASPPVSPGGGEAVPWAEPYGSDLAFLAATEVAERLAAELQWTYTEAETAQRCAHELWRLGWRPSAPPPPGGDGAREARVLAVLEKHEPARLRTDRDGFYRQDCACGWAGSPWQRDDRHATVLSDGAVARLTGRDAARYEYLRHIAALLSEGGEGRG